MVKARRAFASAGAHASAVRARACRWTRRAATALVAEATLVLLLHTLVVPQVPIWLLIVPLIALDYVAIAFLIIWIKFKVSGERKTPIGAQTAFFAIKTIAGVVRVVARETERRQNLPIFNIHATTNFFFLVLPQRQENDAKTRPQSAQNPANTRDNKRRGDERRRAQLRSGALN